MNEMRVHGTKVYVLDPEDEYVDMCRNMPNSEIVNMNANSKNITNIISMKGENFLEKITDLPKIFEVMLGSLNQNQKTS